MLKHLTKFASWFGRDEPQSSAWLDRLRLGIAIFSLAACSGMAGSAVGGQLLLAPTHHVRVNPLVFTALKPAPIAPASLEASVRSKVKADLSGNGDVATEVALNTQSIAEIVKQNQVSIDDRQQIHNTISALASTEVNHYNQLNDRLNVDDARVMTIGWILGVLFTISQAIVVFFHLDRRRSQHRAAYQEVPAYYPPQQQPPPVPFSGTIQPPPVYTEPPVTYQDPRARRTVRRKGQWSTRQWSTK